MTDTVITITGRKLAALLGPVIPLADTGDSVPVLNAVLLRGHGEYLTATATDRYRLGVQRIKLAVPEGWSAIVPLDVAKTLLRTYKPSRKLDPELTLTFERHSVVVESGSLGFSVQSTRIGYRLVDGTYPKVGKILIDAFKDEPIPAGTGVNTAFLAGFGAATMHGEPILIYGGAQRAGRSSAPIGITAGDDFRGVLMSVVLADGSSTVQPMPDEWVALLADAPADESERKAS